MGYEVDLEVFQGPFDLLLELIARRRLDVTEVDLAEITADYLASLDGLELLDLETATRFLVVAATLVELKAARLLPSEDMEEEHDLLAQARDLLYARLLEYRAFRELAGTLEARFDRHAGHHARDVELEARFRRLVPDTPLDVDAEHLARLAARATAPRPDDQVGLDHIRRTFLSIREAAEVVLDRIGTVGARASFRDLVAGRGRTDAVVVFLAALELYKLGQVELDQPDHRGDLDVTRTDADADLAALIAQPTRADIDGTGDTPTGGPAFEIGATDGEQQDGAARGEVAELDLPAEHADENEQAATPVRAAS